MKANTEGMGNILNGEDYGDEPEFDYENPMQSFNANVIKGDSVILFANADEGWEFAEWRDNATGKTYSTDATITITADAPLDLVAVFNEISLPQTGMSGVHKALAGLAALMTLTGVALVKKSRKEDED